MKTVTVTVDVGGLLSPLSVRGVEKQLAKLPGVERADVNFAAGTATVVYDETRTTLAAIKAAVRACGYHCTGEQVPRHVCEPADPPGHAHAAAAWGIPPAEAVATAAPVHAGHAVPHAVPKDEMAHEMGHGAGMDMQAMVRDMPLHAGPKDVSWSRCRASSIAITDAPRPTSAAMVRGMKKRGVAVAMLTGDNRATAERIARELGIDLVIADVLPGQTADKIKELQSQGRKVGMVGDGVNDAPALTQADVGLAIGAGTGVAMERADVVLMRSDPHDVLVAIELSRATLRKMHQNLFWAVAYNVVAFPAAAGVFYPLVISPEVAALAMSGSSALVAVNALLLKRTRLAPASVSAGS